jgi:hypothetical protein
MRAMDRLASMVLISMSPTLLATQFGAAQRSADQQPPPSLVIKSTSIAFSGPQGGPFSPSLIEYRISASTGTVNYSIRAPSWLIASSISGVIDTKGVAITFRVDASAAHFASGTYGPAIRFTNVTNGRGSATFPARLTVQPPPSPPRPAGEIARERGGYLMDGHGGYLLDDRNGRLLAQ